MAVSRRQFLSVAGVAGLSMTASGCLGTASSTPTTGQTQERAPRRVLHLPSDALIRGANVAVKFQHYPRPWHNLWLEWVWDHWIRWQVDLARSLGVNCIRIIGSLSAVAEGDLSTEQYRGRWQQLLDYLGANDVFAYPCLSDLRDWGSGTLSGATDLYRSLGALFDGHATVIGMDVTNEAKDGLRPNTSGRQLEALLDRLTEALRQKTTKPLTHSRSLHGAEDWTQPWVGRFAGISDFTDVHVYYTPARTDAHPMLREPWADRPIIVGEFGIELDEPPSARTARYAAIKELMATDARFTGAFAWDIASDNFGLFDTRGNPRSDVATIFTTFPTEG
jgi:hypothetical protein